MFVRTLDVLVDGFSLLEHLHVYFNPCVKNDFNDLAPEI